jgi:hypothetical protein
MFEGYIDKDNIEFINKVTYKDEMDTEYHVFFEGRIYNIFSLIIMNLEDKKRDLRHTLFELFEHYHFDFKRLNNDVNGDYCLVIVKEVNNKVTDVWMSTDHIGHKKLYFHTGGENGTLIRFSTIDINKYLMPPGHMSHLTINNEGVISKEINTEYDMTAPGKIYTDVENIVTIARFALGCIIDKRIEYIKGIGKDVVVVDNGTFYDKFLVSITPDVLVDNTEYRKEFDSPAFMLDYGNDFIYPFLDKTYMRLIKRITISQRDLVKRLFIKK